VRWTLEQAAQLATAVTGAQHESGPDDEQRLRGHCADERADHHDGQRGAQQARAHRIIHPAG